MVRTRRLAIALLAAIALAGIVAIGANAAFYKTSREHFVIEVVTKPDRTLTARIKSRLHFARGRPGTSYRRISDVPIRRHGIFRYIVRDRFGDTRLIGRIWGDGIVRGRFASRCNADCWTGASYEDPWLPFHAKRQPYNPAPWWP